MVRQRFAKPLFPGSNPGAASKKIFCFDFRRQLPFSLARVLVYALLVSAVASLEFSQ